MNMTGFSCEIYPQWVPNNVSAIQVLNLVQQQAIVILAPYF